MRRRLAILFVVMTPTVLLAAEEKRSGPKPGTFYPSGEVRILKQELKGTKLTLTFKPRDEQFFWCPGIRLKASKKANVATFVRCSVAKDCAIDQKAAIGKRLIRTITIDTKGLDLYVYDSPKKLTRIYEAPKKKAEKK